MGFIKGRMYDYNAGRFLSVDPFIQDPGSTQSLNPYTYIFNNPLSGIDPTGYLVECETDDCSNLNTENIEDIVVNPDGSITANFSDGSSESITAQAAGAAAADVAISSGVGTVADRATLAGAFSGAIAALGNNAQVTSQQLYNAALEGAKSATKRASSKLSGKGASYAARALGAAAAVVSLILFTEDHTGMEENHDATRVVIDTVKAEQQKGGDGQKGITFARQDTTSGGSPTPNPGGGDDDPDNEVDRILQGGKVPHNSKSDLWQMTRSLQKHASRQGSSFSPLKGNIASQNVQAEAVAREIITHPNVIRTQLGRGGVQYRLPNNGRGLRVEPNGKINFVDPSKNVGM